MSRASVAGPGAPARAALVVDVDAQLADPRCRLRPAPVAHERGDVLLVRKTRHVVVRLMGEPGAADAPLRRWTEGRQRAAFGEMMHERRREHRLSRAGEARDAEAHGRLEDLAGGGQQRLRGRAGPVGEIGEERDHECPSDGFRQDSGAPKAGRQGAADHDHSPGRDAPPIGSAPVARSIASSTRSTLARR